VQKHETSTLRQSHNFISIDFKFGVGDYVREVTSLTKFGSDPMSGRAAMCGQHILSAGLFCRWTISLDDDDDDDGCDFF